MEILTVDDDEVICQLLRAQLGSRGFSVTAAAGVAEGRAALRAASFDIVILDLGLPDGSGLDVLATLRASGSTAHVVILSAASSEADRVRALERGADDFVVKPFSVRELTVRVLAIRRRRDPEADTLLRFGQLDIDLRSRRAAHSGTTVDLTPKEFDLLAFLAARPGNAFSRDAILRSVWHSASEWQQEATVTEHVSRLRSKIEADPRRPRLLVTVRGAGYRFDPPVGGDVVPPTAE